jgi:hypothetical protein
VIYAEYDGGRFAVAYAIAADGTVSFTSEPVEVVIDYRPLTADAAGLEETAMSTMKVKDAKGNEIELAQEAIDAVVKAHAPKPAAGQVVDLAAFQALEARVTAQDSTVRELTAKNLALETEAKERDAKHRVEKLITDGRVAPAEREELFTLAVQEPKAFDAVEKQLAKRRRSPTTAAASPAPVRRLGHDREPGSGRAREGRAGRRQDALDGDAMERVFEKNPELYRRYVAETAVKV